MRTRTLLALGLSVVAHALLVTGTRSHVIWDAPLGDPVRMFFVDTASYDELVVVEQVPECEEEEVAIEEMERVIEDPVVKDAKVSDYNETDSDDGAQVIGLGDPSFNSDAPFAGPGTNGMIGIGGGAGGAFGGRGGGRRNLRAGGGGRLADGYGAIAPGLFAKLGGADTAPVPLPLRKTDVSADVAAWIATTRLTQTFANPLDTVIEAVYTMPLPANAAVSAFAMQIGDRRIVGVVRPREEAEKIYAEARRQGLRASLMTQERPNLFTQSVANIAPGTSIDVEITYFHTLRYDRGSYEYVLPMVVAPRYVPGTPTAADARESDSGDVAGGGGTAADTGQVPDASRISPPLLVPGAASGRVLTFALSIDAGVTIRAVESATHAIEVERSAGHRARVSLPDGDVATDRDLVVRWQVAGDDVAAGSVAHRGDLGGYFSAFLIPPLDPRDADTSPREITFVMDTSGSMGGLPIETSKAVVERVLGEARTFDKFNVIRFAGSSGSFAEAPVECSPDNVAAGLAYVQDLKGGGGTEMLAGLAHWLSQPADPRYVRVVAFLTDGFVGNEEAILGMIREKGQDARWYAFGIGSSVNRFLIEGIAEQGKGVAEVVENLTPEHARAAGERMVRRLDAPMLTDVTVDANGLPVSGLHPRAFVDLTTGQPLVVFGRFDDAAEGELLVRGRVAGRDTAFAIPLTLPADEPEHDSIARLWARAEVHDLDNALLTVSDESDRAELLGEMERLGVEYGLITRRTAYVAVDESTLVPGHELSVRVLQPQELPHGVRYWGVVGRPATGGVDVADWGVLLAEARAGEVVVAHVTERGEAAKAGLLRGFVVETVGGHRVHDTRHLATLLGAATGTSVEIGYRNGAGEALRRVRLPIASRN